MLVNAPLARQIAEKAKSILRREIFMTDLGGQLLAGHTNARSFFVAEALNVSQTGLPITSTFEGQQTKWWPFVYEDRTIAVFGLPLDAGPITQEAMTLLQGLSEVIIYQHFLLDRIQSAERIRSDFIKNTLTAQSIDPEDIQRQADILQLNLRSPQAVILINIQDFEKAVRKQFAELSIEEQQLRIDKAGEQISNHLRDSFQNFQDNLIAYFGNDQFALLKGIGGDAPTTINTIRFMIEKADYAFESLQKLPQKFVVTLGVGQFYPDFGGLRKSYQDARLALEVGSRVWGLGQVYHIKRVGMFITLANTSQERKAELAHQILSPLLRDEQLYKTVQSFLGCGLNLTDAAEKLHIHRNTLIYRLDKTKKLIGLDPRHFDDALQIKLGLMFYQQS